MFLFLPAQDKGVDGLVQELDGATWEKWMSEFHETADLKVHMPKFKFDYGRSLEDDLKAMGLEIAGSPSELWLGTPLKTKKGSLGPLLFKATITPIFMTKGIWTC